MDINFRKSEISRSLEDVRERIRVTAKSASREVAEVNLIVVTKTFPISDVEILKTLSINDFAENRSSDGYLKIVTCFRRWHFQGQIQSNKIKSISQWADVIHSLMMHDTFL
ncbi:MAG: hypothetical protein WDO06_10150 [Actinomycetota bacterium]